MLAGRWTYDRATSRPIDPDLRITVDPSGTLQAEGGSSGPFDFDLMGGSHPLSNGRTIAWLPTGSDTWQVTKKRNEEVLETSAVRLAGDTPSSAARGKLPDGSPFERTVAYRRSGRGNGLIGRWRCVKVDTGATWDGFVISTFADGVVTWRIPTDLQVIHGSFDGSDLPNVSTMRPNVPRFSPRHQNSQHCPGCLSRMAEEHNTESRSETVGGFTAPAGRSTPLRVPRPSILRSASTAASVASRVSPRPVRSSGRGAVGRHYGLASAASETEAHLPSLSPEGWGHHVPGRNRRRSFKMPVAYLDLPSGLAVDAKKTLLKKVAEFIHHAYMIPDTRVILGEWPAEQFSIDGELGRPLRPVCNFVVPPGLPVEAKRELAKRVSAAIAEACDLPREEVSLPSGKKVTTRCVLGFFREYPVNQASLDDLMALENPMVLESAEAAMQAPKGRAR
jgi:hypothetical protein